MGKTHKRKHNKKRNTAFLYEVLIQDITRSVVNKDQQRKEVALSICKEFFNRNSVLYAEKELYVSLLESRGTGAKLLEKMVVESKRAYAALDQKKIFNSQTKLINKINKKLSADVFGNFVNNYKDLATLSQIFNQDLSIRQRVLLENDFVEQTSNSSDSSNADLEPTDNLVYRTFVKSYNKKYENQLLSEQKELVTRYATSFSDNGLSLKVYLNEEFGRLKDTLEKSLDTSIIKEDQEMLSKAKKVLSIVESYKQIPVFEEDTIIQILEIQRLVKEIEL